MSLKELLQPVREVVDPLVVGFRNVFRKPFTFRYPEVRLVVSERYRGWIHLDKDRCIECEVCALTCDGISQAITMVHTPDSKRRGFPQIDFGKCIYCGFCVDYCPVKCLDMKPIYDYSDYDRKNLEYNPYEMDKEPPEDPRAKLHVVFDRWGAHHEEIKQ